MNRTNKKIIIIIIFFVCSCRVLSQQTTDGNFLFKIWFFIEKVNTKSREAVQYPIKDSSLFSFFNKNINLKTDTLKSKGFSKNYIFLSVMVLKDNKIINDSAISFSKTSLLEYLSIPVNDCDGYLLCINTSTGTSYRLKGFLGNDFLILLKDVKGEFNNKAYNQEQKLTLSTKVFLKNYSVDGLDFKCIYQGLISGETDSKKYPCLTSCRNAIIVVH